MSLSTRRIWPVTIRELEHLTDLAAIKGIGPKTVDGLVAAANSWLLFTSVEIIPENAR